MPKIKSNKTDCSYALYSVITFGNQTVYICITEPHLYQEFFSLPRNMY